jgi:transposase, IS5 family
MRKTRHPQLPLSSVASAHRHTAELKTMSEVLDACPRASDLVLADLVRREDGSVSAEKGCEGMTGEQVLRALLVKQMNGYSYEDLSFDLSDSAAYRNFCRLGLGQLPPTTSTLQKNIKRVTPETLEAINQMMVGYAKEQQIESGEKVRTDCTVVESNIHAPTDSSLLWDVVRVLTRLMTYAKEHFGVEFKDRTLRAKRRAMGILNARSSEKRFALYRDLLSVTNETLSSATRIADKLAEMQGAERCTAAHAESVATELRHYVALGMQVVSQTERRVMRGETVPSSEKVVSLFEPHTDIIVKDRRDTFYGHKVCLTTGASGVVTDLVIEKGNPADATLAVKMIERHAKVFGELPLQAAFDGGFASKANLEAIKALGVGDVAFAKGRGLSVMEMVRDVGVYRMLRNFRAGIEGVISFLKRNFGWTRCTWRGWNSFRAYVWGSTVACNVLVIARRLLDPSR